MHIHLIADVHGDIDSLTKCSEICDVLIVLGDLINVIDYATAGGVFAEVYGVEVVKSYIALRSSGTFDEARSLLRSASEGREDELRAEFLHKVDLAHKDIVSSIPPNVVLTHGNVDVPQMIQNYLPPTVRYLDGESIELNGEVFGFVGGALPKVGIPGESTHEEFAAKLDALGRVDVVCTHIPPQVEGLVFDTVASAPEPGSESLLKFIHEIQPRRAYFGHVHQPRVESTKIGSTEVINVGAHFRRTKQAVVHDRT